ncbi:non-ribosomal peptide synthetase [Tumebacillus lipolyticus]|uniref:Amino acid adenylation domain-containing protein n=1 Tax=Tumebacillus lipolyticus TaxID=1280370 RepID=A0ABW4ZTV7_9BACL
MSRFSKFSMSKEKRALLEKMLQEEGMVAVSLARIEKRAEQGPANLSSSQQRLWFLDRMESGSTTYNMPYKIDLRGDLQLTALEAALNEIVERHEILRTVFRRQDGEVQQIVQARQAVQIERLMLSKEELDRLALQEAQRPFDLSAGPLMRATLVQTGEREHTLLLTLHHIVFDGWSMGVLFQELTTLYEAFVEHRPSPLAELPLQYSDYAHWQQEWLQGEEFQKQLSYWQTSLAGAPVVLDLPTDQPRPLLPSYRGGNRSFSLPSVLATELKSWSQGVGATLFMTMFGAFAALLYRYTGQSDLLIGAPVAGRNLRETEGLIGFFVNTLVLRADLTEDPTFAELLHRVKGMTTEALSHQELPFDKLVEHLQPVRDPSRSPLFQVMFNFLESPHEERKFSGLSLTHGEVLNGTAKFDLTLYVEDGPDGIKGNFEYNRDLFAEATVARMADHLQTLLESVLTHPHLPLSHLPLITDAERDQALFAWNETRTEYPRDLCIHQLVERQAAVRPDAVATLFDGTELTYAELNGRANRLAHLLRKQGVAPDVLVGLCVERSHEMVVGMLGILKAGGAYVPLDPAYPAERLAFMADDADLQVIVTQSHLTAGLPQRARRLICLDSDLAEIERESDQNLISLTEATHLAYVVYTSGSTGTPKGVLVPHRAVNRLVCNTDYVQLDETDVVGQVSNSSFDAATFEVWGALINGGKLVGVTKEMALTPKAFAGAIKEHGVTAMFVTAALFNQIVAAVPDAFSELRHLLVGGEALDPRWVRAAIRGGRPKRLLNGYGPTESTTFATYHLIEEIEEDTTNIPIGRPIANTTAYVLDGQLQLLPIGVPGELYLGGDGVARGYLNRPELTAERFLQHPFGEGMLYRTGDLVRRLPDGSIEYIGRLDSQVKVRGFRIELGEIEQAIATREDVLDAVAIVREEEPGDKRIVAYVVPKRADSFSVQELRGKLKESLPEYMLPSAIVTLEAMPLTVNGKLDRQALPRPSGSAQSDDEYAAPRTEAEEHVLAIWQDVLQVERIGIHDNFFDLGGHSLLLIKVHERLQEKLDAQFSIVELFRHTTVYTLTKWLTESKGVANNSARAEESQTRASSKKDVINRRKQLSKGRGK